MAYKCPRCGKDVAQGTNAGAAAAGGAVGALIAAAFGSFACPDCGPIPRREFPPEDHRRMFLGSLTLVLVALGLLVAVIVFLIWWQRP